MNQNQKGSRPKYFRGMRVYTPARAQAALPYVAQILRSLREYTIEFRLQRHLTRRLRDSNRKDRGTLIAIQEAVSAADYARGRYEEALDELRVLDVYCPDPVQGVALFPFAKGKQLAWFVFDLHDEAALQSWRYQSDPGETRRPLSELTPAKST